MDDKFTDYNFRLNFYTKLYKNYTSQNFFLLIYEFRTFGILKKYNFVIHNKFKRLVENFCYYF